MALSAGVVTAQQAEPRQVARTNKIALKIAPQPIGDALNEFARQSGLHVVLYSDLAKGLKSARLEGEYTPEDALQQLLAHTGLHFEYLDTNTVAVLGPQKESARGVTASARELMHDEGGASDAGGPSVSDAGGGSSGAGGDAESSSNLDEVVITGSNIRGNLEYQASESVNLTRTDIERTGATDVAGLLQTIPQNFSGGTYSATPDGVFGTNTTKGSVLSGSIAPNLRGLGTDSTLSLLDGHRLAPTEAGAVVDIGLIPLDAIERVDVLTDGASAIYGTDAIGGVVNLILRKDYEGVETSVDGSSDDGAHYKQGQFATTAGHGWGSGNGLLAVDYSEQTPLLSKYRAFSNALPVIDTPTGTYQSDLYPDERQISVLGNFRQELGPVVDLSGDVFFGHRNYSQDFTNVDLLSPTETYYTYNRDDSAVNELSTWLSLGVKLPADWRFQTELLYGRTDAHPLQLEDVQVPQLKLVETLDTPADQSSKLYSVISKADGSLLSLPAGDAKAAVGIEYRHESYDSILSGTTIVNGGKPTVTTTTGADARNLHSAFLETSIPVVSPDFHIPGMQSVAVTGAVRYDDYSDVGNTTNYKVGLKWHVVDSFTLRGTRSTSFRAPDLGREVSVGQGNSVASVANYYIGPNGKTVPVVRLSGTSPLVPETATATTAGFDFTPFKSLKLGATAFKYDYINRFAYAPVDPNEINEPAEYGSLVTPVTSVAQIQELIARIVAAGGKSSVVMPYTLYQYIIDGSFRNLSREDVRGLDVDLTGAWSAGDFSIEHSLSGTLMSWDKNQVLATALPIDTVGQVGYQPRFRARGSTTLSQSRWAITGALNYVSEFYNGTEANAEHVGSWLTFDTTARVTLDSSARNQLGFSIINAFNRDPPYVYRSPPGGPFYDPANANPLGRVFTLRYTRKW